ncbi:proline-rich protein 2-like [Cervus elaphus]|uniref:proline-rich protein 2-like n=1 Tax=Cervus elaphus TaxID=9860 RepID=UPI001CC2FFD0|nr:proline-rich protein 2-like [Cervus elaphus]
MKADFVIAKLNATPAHKRGNRDKKSRSLSAPPQPPPPQPHSHRGARYTNTEAPPPSHDRTVSASHRREAEGERGLEPAETPIPRFGPCDAAAVPQEPTRPQLASPRGGNPRKLSQISSEKTPRRGLGGRGGDLVRGGPCPQPQTCGSRVAAGRVQARPRAPTEAPLPHPATPEARRRPPHSALAAAAAPALPQPAGRPPTRLGHQRSRRQPEAPKQQRRRRPRRGALVPGRWEASEASLTHLRLPAPPPPPPEAAPLPATPTVGGPGLETRRGQASPGSGCGSAEQTSPPPAHPPSAKRATPLGPVPALTLVRRRRRRPRRRGPTWQAPPPAPSLAAGEGGLGTSGTPIGCVHLPSGPP